MKKQLLYFLILLLLPVGMAAQDGYSFTLLHNGGYNFSVAAVPNFDSGAFTPTTESYGFTLVVPDGITISLTDVQPSGSSETITPIAGSSVSAIDPNMADKDLFLITVITNAGTLPAHITDSQLPLVTFDVNGSPATGDLTLLDNNSVLASSPALSGALDSFIQVDVTDDASVNFINAYLGQSGLTTFSFSTLSTQQYSGLDLELYPNPVINDLFIKGQINSIESIHFYTINGQLLKQITENFESITISDLEPSIYFLNVKTTEGSKTFKLVKN